MNTTSKYVPMQRMAPHYKNWFVGYQWDVAATFNFDANVSREAAVKTMMQHWHRKDCKEFGATQVKTNNMRFVRACFLGGETKLHNWHYHCAVQLPAEARFGSKHDRNEYCLEYCAFLLDGWDRFKEAGKFSLIEPIENEARWVKYICEEEGYGEGEFCTRTSFLI